MPTAKYLTECKFQAQFSKARAVLETWGLLVLAIALVCLIPIGGLERFGTIAVVIAACGLVLLSLRLRYFWSVQRRSYTIHESMLYMILSDEHHLELDLTKLLVTSHRGLLGETYGGPTGGYALTSISDGYSTIVFSPEYLPDLAAELKARELI